MSNLNIKALEESVVRALESHDIEDFLLHEHYDEVSEEAWEQASSEGYETKYLDQDDIHFSISVNKANANINGIMDMIIVEKDIPEDRITEYLESSQFIEDCYQETLFVFDIEIIKAEISKMTIINAIESFGIDETLMKDFMANEENINYEFEVFDAFLDEGFNGDQAGDLMSQEGTFSIKNIKFGSSIEAIADDLISRYDDESIEDVYNFIGTNEYYEYLWENKHVDYEVDILVSIDEMENEY